MQLIKQNRSNLISWFEELGLERKSLPYEITKVFFDNESKELHESVYDSFDHIERIFSFGNLFCDDYEDEEEIWSDLLISIELTSYYSCLAMPLVRQLLESNESFMYTSINSENRLDLNKLPPQEESLQIRLLSGMKRELAEEAWGLSRRINELKRQYILISSAKDLVDWSKNFLECSASLVSLAVRLSFLNDK